MITLKQMNNNKLIYQSKQRQIVNNNNKLFKNTIKNKKNLIINWYLYRNKIIYKDRLQKFKNRNFHTLSQIS